MCRNRRNEVTSLRRQVTYERNPVRIRGEPDQKSAQHENKDNAEMRKYFCTKFCSFVSETAVQKYDADLCYFYLTYRPGAYTPN